ncbi:MAG: HAD family hydrolase [Chloroflexi bacterium]|nr:HAD family hydrolase [Chloroflexota bacterium]
MQKDRALDAVAGAAAASNAILFDLFHTLSAIEVTNSPLPPETWEILGLEREEWQQAWRASNQARNRGESTDPYEMVALPARALDPAIDEQLIRAAVQTRLGKFANALLHIAPGVLETLAALRQRGKKLGLVSNADSMEIAAWPRSPLRAAFDTAVFSCQVGCCKPEPDIYLRACRDLSVSPGECLFVGDGGSRELWGAKQLGMTTVHMTGILARFWPERVAECGAYADYSISDLRALLGNP